MPGSRRAPLLLRSFWAIWRLVFLVIEFTGRLVRGILGLILTVVGVDSNITVVGVIVGISLAIHHTNKLKIRLDFSAEKCIIIVTNVRVPPSPWRLSVKIII